MPCLLIDVVLCFVVWGSVFVLFCCLLLCFVVFFLCFVVLCVLRWWWRSCFTSLSWYVDQNSAGTQGTQGSINQDVDRDHNRDDCDADDDVYYNFEDVPPG